MSQKSCNQTEIAGEIHVNQLDWIGPSSYKTFLETKSFEFGCQVFGLGHHLRGWKKIICDTFLQVFYPP